MRWVLFALLLLIVFSGCESILVEDPAEPNDDMDSAYELYPGKSITGYISSQDDLDYFIVPTDSLPVQGGVLIFSLEPFPMEPSLTIYNHDRAEIAYAYETTTGANLHIWMAVKSGTFYYALVTPWGGWSEERSSEPYTFTVSCIEVPDPYEPDNDPDEATPIEADSTYHPYLFAGEPQSSEDYADCFRFTAETAGTLWVRVEDVPDDLSIEVYIYNSDGAEISYSYQTTDGASITLTRAVEPGDYYIKVKPWSSPPWHGKGDTPPDHVLNPYSIKVTLK